MTNWLTSFWDEVVEGGERASAEAILSPRHLTLSDINGYLARDSSVADWRDAHLKGCYACLGDVAAAATERHLAGSLDRVEQWPRIGLSETRGATPYLCDGETSDRLLRWTVTEDQHGNGHIVLATGAMELENRRIRIEAGTNAPSPGRPAWKPVAWSADALLQPKPLGAGHVQLEAEVVVTAPECLRFPQAATLKLTVLDGAANSVDAAKAEAVAERLTGECLANMTKLVRQRVFGIPPDIADELVQRFVVERFIPIARNYDPGRAPFWAYVKRALWRFLSQKGPEIQQEANTVRKLHDMVMNGQELEAEKEPLWGDNAGPHDALALQLLNALPLRERQLIGLKFRDDLTYPEIAAVTGYPQGSIKAWIYRAFWSVRITAQLNAPESHVAALTHIVQAKGPVYVLPMAVERLAELVQSTKPDVALLAFEAVAALGTKVRTKRIVEACQAVLHRTEAPDELIAAARKALGALAVSHVTDGSVVAPSPGASGNQRQRAARADAMGPS